MTERPVNNPLNDLRLRLMTAVDIPAVMAIEQQVQFHPWRPPLFDNCLQTGNLALVAESAGEVVGFAVMAIGGGEAELLNIAVAPIVQRQGVAKQLLAAVVGDACRRGAERVFLEVRVSNLAAQNLYHRWGFTEVGRRPNYYPAPDGREDALVFTRPCSPPAP